MPWQGMACGFACLAFPPEHIHRDVVNAAIRLMSSKCHNSRENYNDVLVLRVTYLQVLLENSKINK